MAAKRTRLNGPMPYYKWLALDYRASRNANALTWIERGLYRELLDECWLEGGIPERLEKLAEICRCPLPIMADAWRNLGPMFSAASSVPGLISHPKIEDQRTEADATRLTRAAAGKAGGASKCKQMQANASKGNTPQANPDSSSSSSSNSSSTGMEAIACAPVAPPAPHGAARLADGLDALVARVQRGEIRRETIQ